MAVLASGTTSPAPPVEGWVTVIRWAALGVWLGIPVIGLTAQPLAGRIVWTVAIASLPLFILLVGFHRWRIICPLAWFNQLPLRLGWPAGRRVPAWLERHYVYVPLSLFTVGLWLRLIWANGDGGAIVLFFVGLSLVAVLAGVLTTGKTWCNYVCPVSFIEKIYTEPIGLRQTRNSQCATCTACKKACPDINEENAYWKEIDLPSKRAAYFAYPGLIFGFYFYYYLQSGTWDYYFGGAWTDEPGIVWHAFSPGLDVATAGFFFWPAIPRAVAALLTLLCSAATSWTIFGRIVEPVVVRWIRHHPGRHARNVVFAVAAFTAFVMFYTFAGQPTLRKIDWLPGCAAILTVTVATLSLARRLGRTPEAFAEQSVAQAVLKRGDRFVAYSEVVQGYREAVRDNLLQGLVTRADVQRLGALRDRLRIRITDHERIMQELADEASSLAYGPAIATPEKRLQLVAYARGLQEHLDLLMKPDGVSDTAITQLQARYGVTRDEHWMIVADLLGHSQRAAQAVEALVAYVHAIDRTLSALETDLSPATEFLSQLLCDRRQRAIARATTVLPSSPDQWEMGDGQFQTSSLQTCLREHLSDNDPYVRAAALACLRERGLADSVLLQELAADEHDLVRENAGPAPSGGTFDKMLALQQVGLFKELEPAGLALLARASVRQRFLPGETMCAEGEPGEDVFTLLAGEAEVVQGHGRGQHCLRIQGPGDVIGEMAVLDPAPRSATVRARSNGAEVLTLKGSAFRDVVVADGLVAATVIQTLVRRLRATQPEIEDSERIGRYATSEHE